MVETPVILETSDGVLEEVTKEELKPESALESESKPAKVVDLDEEPPKESQREPSGEPSDSIDNPDGLDPDRETAKKQLRTPEKPTLGMRLHAINVRMPWLKVILLVLLAGSVALGVEELLRHNVSQPVGAPVDLAVEPGVPEEKTSAEPTETTPKKPTEEKPTPETSEIPATSQPAPVQPSAPAPPATPTRPVNGKGLIALTFDDGPSAVQTPRLLQILREKNVKATFFVLGKMAQRSPDILRQEEADGHEVASHTMTHANLNRATIEGIQWEVAAVNGVFMDILGHGPSLTRPPYGNINNNVRTYVNQPLILWTVDPEDWKYKNAATVRQNVVSRTFDGAIILLHDIHATTVDAVVAIIDDLRAAGYEFVTVSELAAARGVVMQNGVSYGSFRP